MDYTIPPAEDQVLLAPCASEIADIRWRGKCYELCGRKALILAREYWEWAAIIEAGKPQAVARRVTACEQDKKKVRATQVQANLARKKQGLSPLPLPSAKVSKEERQSIVDAVNAKFDTAIHWQDVPVRARSFYSPFAEKEQPEGWDQLEQRLRNRWGPLWAESMTWPNPLWTARVLDWAWLDAMTGTTENEPAAQPDGSLRVQGDLFVTE